MNMHAECHEGAEARLGKSLSRLGLTAIIFFTIKGLLWLALPLLLIQGI